MSSSEDPEPPKRRRRSGWDSVPATAPTQDASVPLVSQVALPPLGNTTSGLTLGQNILLPQVMQNQISNPMMPSIPSMPVQSLVDKNRAMDSRIYVGSLHYSLGQPEILALFSCFGTITKFDLSHDPLTGRSKGYAFIEFADPASAQAATAMDGFELAQRKIKVGRPLNGAYAQGSAGAVSTITPIQQAAQQAAMIALGAGSFMPSTAMNIPSSFAVAPGVVSAPAPVTASSVTLTPAQQSAKERAQALLNKLGQSVGLVPSVSTAVVLKTTKTIVIKNVREEVGIEELSSIFASFGPVLSCVYTGDAYTVTSALGLSTSVRMARVEYEAPQHATDALSMHQSNLAGVLITVELLPYVAPSITAVSSSSSSVRNNSNSSSTVQESSGSSTAESSTSTVVKLEHMVKSAEEVFEEDFKEEIADEASNYGTLIIPSSSSVSPVTVTINGIDVTNDDLESFIQKKKDIITNSGGDNNDSDNDAVIVYLHYDNPSGAMKAQKAMNGRFFAGQTIKATLL